MKQFPNVSCAYGAPMGRYNTDHNGPLEVRSVRLFKVRINSGGYDDGGVYWGLGTPIYCATNDAGYFETIRAASRLQAIVGLELSADCLKSKGPGFKRLRELEARGCISASGIILRQHLQELGFKV